jgi:hypothetical protein
LGSLGITIIRRPRQTPILVALQNVRQITIQIEEREFPSRPQWQSIAVY